MDLQQSAGLENGTDIAVSTEPEETGKKKKNKKVKDKSFKKKNKTLKNVIIAVVVLAVAAGGYFGYRKFFAKSAEAKITTATVERGDISVVISGSGTIAPIEQYDVTSLVKGEILTSPFEEGGAVNKGDVLYTIDTKDIQNSIEKAKLAVETKERDYQKNLDTISDLSVKSPIGGVITNVYVKEGDDVSNNAKIADVVDNSKLLLKAPFLASDARSISAGEAAEVTLTGVHYALDGYVSRVASGTTVNDDGVEISNVEIVVNNPGAIKTGDEATASVGSIACNDTGVFESYAQQTVLAKTAGTVEKLPYMTGDKIDKNTIVAYLTNDSTDDSIEASRNSLKDAQLALQNQYDQLENYTITSPISGTVLQKTSKAGDNIDNSNSSTVMAIIADMSTIVFDMSIDELDIVKISEGQKVSVTADAVENKTFSGHVDNISVVGTSSNGVTSYPVRIVVDDPEGLIPGMNVNAEIVVESRQNVLKVPVAAVKRGNIVTVKITDENSAATPGEGAGRPEGATGENGAARTRRSDGAEGQAGAAGGQSGDGSQAGAAAGQGGASTGQTAGQGNAGTRSGGSGSGAANGGSGSGYAGGANASGNANARNNTLNANVPAGYKNVVVQVGLNDESYIEIVSGLNEGDVVVIPTVQSTTSTNVMQGGMGMGAPMGGGGTVIRTGPTSGGGGSGTYQRSTGGSSGAGTSQRSNTGGASR